MARSSKSSNGSTKQSDKTKDSDGEPESGVAGADPEMQEAESVLAETAADDAIDSDDRIAEAEAPEEPLADEAPADVPDAAPARPDAPPPPPQPLPASRPSALGTILGGLVAGAIGFVVATFAVPEGWPNPAPSGLDAIESAVAEQGGRIDSLSADLAAVRDAAPVSSGGDIAPLEERITAVETQITEALASLDESLAGLDARFGDIDARLAELESRPSLPAGADGSAAMEVRLEEFRKQLDAVTADAQARIAEAQNRTSQIEAEAAATRAAAERAAALSALRVALDNGTPFTDTLAALPAVPEPLAAQAAGGVPTLSSLQTAFPKAARDALSQVRAVPDDASPGDRVIAFLKRRTNARSLSPREGDDADAVLSRTEAALANGDLGTVLTELAALPEAARESMSGWIAAAETRAAALSAFATLETEIK